ncbi:protein P21-like [Phalaenopsis equestris]|uniref:protein P21-like n=1 Tax=Phalaenopsis equestris TaxID=78828 RepID=UPI0009E1D5DB|nr:protein P21-like [Phalaenopsis equestris]
MTSSPLLSLLLLPFAKATIFTLINNCHHTIWPAAVPGGGRELAPGERWSLARSPSACNGRFWARTNCSFDGEGKGRCLAGDCNGALSCDGDGSPPATLVEYSLYQYGNNDFYDVSLVDGFNVPVEIRPTTADCMAARCTADVAGECPAELKTAGGCMSACQVYKTNQYCCEYGSCGPTKYSRLFKKLCPDAYSYAEDDATSTFTCKSGGDYIITFCPS